jgi:signal peptidase I
VVDLEALKAQHRKAEQRAHLLREIIETVLLTALIFLVVHITIQDFRVDGPSMQPGLQANQYLLVNSTAYWFGSPSRGDVIVFHQHHIHADSYDLANGCTADAGTGGQYMSCDYVKRVIALPGDTVEITATQVKVDGTLLTEPYIQVPPGESQSTVVVPATKLTSDQYFVMGDNRLNSSDSRFFGPISRSNIVGRVVMVFWPLNQAHWLTNYSSVFTHVKP